MLISSNDTSIDWESYWPILRPSRISETRVSRFFSLWETSLMFVTESSYAEVRSRSPLSPPSFLHFLVSRYDSASPHVNFDRVRLKTILFLATSVNYDAAGTKKELEELEMKGLRGLTLERAIVYGKVCLAPSEFRARWLTTVVLQLQLDRQALSLLLHSLRDLTSSETYCHQSGDPLLSSDLFATASLLNLSMPTKSRTKPGAPQGGKTERKASLARLLVEMFLSKRVGEENADAADEAGVNEKQRQVARILETQAIHLDCLEVRSFFRIEFSFANNCCVGPSPSTGRLVPRPLLLLLRPLTPPITPFSSRSCSLQVALAVSKFGSIGEIGRAPGEYGRYAS